MPGPFVMPPSLTEDPETFANEFSSVTELIKKNYKKSSVVREEVYIYIYVWQAIYI